MAKPLVGIVAIQGDFEKHREAVLAADAGAEVRYVRTPEDLADVDCLILPGGESSTVGKLMERFGLGEAIRERADEGLPIWGTCMGMILLSKEIESSDQYSLGLMDITVRRNAFGSQVHSFEDYVEFVGLEEPVLGVYIRAPIVTRVGEGVTPMATYEGKCVAVRQGNILGTSFHPELTSDTRLHAWFLSWLK